MFGSLLVAHCFVRFCEVSTSWVTVSKAPFENDYKNVNCACTFLHTIDFHICMFAFQVVVFLLNDAHTRCEYSGRPYCSKLLFGFLSHFLPRIWFLGMIYQTTTSQPSTAIALSICYHIVNFPRAISDVCLLVEKFAILCTGLFKHGGTKDIIRKDRKACSTKSKVEERQQEKTPLIPNAEDVHQDAGPKLQSTSSVIVTAPLVISAGAFMATNRTKSMMQLAACGLSIIPAAFFLTKAANCVNYVESGENNSLAVPNHKRFQKNGIITRADLK